MGLKYIVTMANSKIRNFWVKSDPEKMGHKGSSKLVTTTGFALEKKKRILEAEEKKRREKGDNGGLGVIVKGQSRQDICARRPLGELGKGAHRLLLATPPQGAGFQETQSWLSTMTQGTSSTTEKEQVTFNENIEK